MNAPAPPLLTGRELVAELQRLGVGTWTADAVRQWIREAPACPVAEAADQGKPHRYLVADVLAWLKQRALAERMKGFTRADGTELASRIDQALARLADPSADAACSKGSDADSAMVATNGGRGRADHAAPVSPAKGPITGDEAERLSEKDLLLEVLKGRDARGWKAAEEALQIRNKRLVEERRLIPADEFERAIETMVVLLLAGLAQLPAQLADQVPDQSTRVQRLSIAQRLADSLRDRLARAEVRDA